MTTTDAAPVAAPRRTLWRIALFVLLFIPAIPSIYLIVLSLQGKAAGCDVTAGACIVGGVSLGETAKRALDLAAGFSSFFAFLGGLWFALCLYPIHRSFAGPGSRLASAIFVAGWCVIGATVSGFIALSQIAPHCSFNEGGVGTCRIFGVATQSGHHIGTAIWGIMIGMPIAALVFLVYVIFVAIIANRSKPKTLTFPPRS